MFRYLKIFLFSMILLNNLQVSAHQFKYPRAITLYFTPKRIYFNITYQIEQGGKAQNLRFIFDINQDNILNLKEQQKLVNFLFNASRKGLQLTLNKKKLKIKKNKINVSNVNLPLPNDLQLNINYSNVFKVKANSNNIISFSLNKSFADEKLPLHLQKNKNIQVVCRIKNKNKIIKKIVFKNNLDAIVLLPEHKLICKY